MDIIGFTKLIKEKKWELDKQYRLQLSDKVKRMGKDHF